MFGTSGVTKRGTKSTNVGMIAPVEGVHRMTLNNDSKLTISGISDRGGDAI